MNKSNNVNNKHDNDAWKFEPVPTGSFNNAHGFNSNIKNVVQSKKKDNDAWSFDPTPNGVNQNIGNGFNTMMASMNSNMNNFNNNYNNYNNAVNNTNNMNSMNNNFNGVSQFNQNFQQNQNSSMNNLNNNVNKKSSKKKKDTGYFSRMSSLNKGLIVIAIIIGIIITFLVVFAVVKQNNITCTKTEIATHYTAEDKLRFVIKNGMVTKVNRTYEMEYKVDLTDDIFDKVASEINNSQNGYTKYGLGTNINREKNKIIITAYEEMNISVDQAKFNYEGKGYICK